MDFELVVNLESWADSAQRPHRTLRLDVRVENGRMDSWKVTSSEEASAIATSREPAGAAVVLARCFEFKIPLSWLHALPAVSGDGGASAKPAAPVATKLRLRFSLWQNRLPVDALPVEGWIELHLLSEDELEAMAQ